MQHTMASAVIGDLLKERRTERRWRLVRRVGIALAFLMGLTHYVIFYSRVYGFSFEPRQATVAVIHIEGSIMQTSLASADKIIPALKRAFEADQVKAVILAIDSPGGAPVEAERITYLIDDLKKRHKKPVHAVIQNMGASAAYMIALHADKIYAGRYSIVGSIGAVMSTWDVHRALARFDVYQKVYASGPLKAMANPFVESSPAAEKKAQDLIDIMGGRFLDELRRTRAGHLKDLAEYGTGEVWDGAAAKDLGLVDEIGTVESVASTFGDVDVRDYGPKSASLRLFGTSASEWLQDALVRSAQQLLSDQPAVR
ncbi:hypothetical protein BKK80_34800 (plasmid) [Cupriavidus malaysiensis]|uniref:Peptidase S49 domain-containing protein n=2 Tax=Cupriavidus malaysiensis TaxID=367825 RepID=A0ABM6FGP8_9BURK|nr:hypothetical protein BKK80_34800 [Cupriavidus malaysiensis]